MREKSEPDTAIEMRRRKLIFRSWHRGMREVDLILGAFADASMDELSEQDLDQYEALLSAPDGDLLSWVTGELAVPASHDTPLLRKIIAFARKSTFAT